MAYVNRKVSSIGWWMRWQRSLPRESFEWQPGSGSIRRTDQRVKTIGQRPWYPVSEGGWREKSEASNTPRMRITLGRWLERGIPMHRAGTLGFIAIIFSFWDRCDCDEPIFMRIFSGERGKMGGNRI